MGRDDSATALVQGESGEPESYKTPADNDPVMAAFLNAPTDDWQETDEYRAVVAGAKAHALAGGRMIPHADVMAMVERQRFTG